MSNEAYSGLDKQAESKSITTKPGGLPALPEPVLKLVHRVSTDISRHFLTLSDQDEDLKRRKPGYTTLLAATSIKVTTEERGILREWLPTLMRQATPEEVAVETGLLVAAYPNLGEGADGFAHIATSDIYDEQPSVYMLQTACRAVRRNNKFLHIATLITELENARHVQEVLHAMSRAQDVLEVREDDEDE